MATTLKRLTISLPDDVAEAVDALAQVQGIPQSKVIVQTLREFEPAMLAICKIHKQMKAGEKEAAKQTIRHLMGDQMAELLREQMDLAPALNGAKK